jgi:hypothetical protein
MSPGAILSEAWGLYKEHWQHFLPIALVVYIVLGLAALALSFLGWVGALLASLIGLIGVFWLQGALTVAVADVRDGRADLSIGDTFRRVQPRLLSIIGAGLLAGIAIVIGLILLIVPGLFLLTIWSLIVPAIVLEGKAAMESFGRSRELVRGNGWNVFGLIVLTILIVIAIGIVIAILTFWLPDSIQAFVQNVISNTLAYPLVALAWTLMYFALERPEAEPSVAPAAPMPSPAPPPPGP